ncbi:MAG: hypothetical protein IKS83_09815 [Victivallales bacterium]|nr:hypothetical protein [Victivallales bacterium]
MQQEIPQELSALVRKYRELVHDGELSEKVLLAREIVRLRPHDQDWRKTLRELEISWKAELSRAAGEAMAQNRFSELERIYEVLSGSAWQEPPQKESLRRLEAVLAQMRQRQWEQEGQAICEQLDRQYRSDLEGGLRQMADWFEQWDALCEEHPEFEPTTEQKQLLAVIRPNWESRYREWQKQQEASREYQQLLTQLERAIKVGASRQELLELHDRLERLEKEVPESLMQRYDTALRMTQLKEFRRTLISWILFLVILLLVGGGVFFSFREWSHRHLSWRYLNQLRPILEDPTRDAAEADAIVKEVREQHASLLARSEFANALLQLGQKKGKQAAMDAEFHGYCADLHELLPHYQANQAEIIRLRGEILGLCLVPEMARERTELLAECEQAMKQYVEEQDNEHQVDMATIQKLYVEFESLLEEGNEDAVAQAGERLEQMREVLKGAQQLDGISDKARNNGRQWQNRLKRAEEELGMHESLEEQMRAVESMQGELEFFVTNAGELSWQISRGGKREIDGLPPEFHVERLNGVLERGWQLLEDSRKSGSPVQQVGNQRGRKALARLEELLRQSEQVKEDWLGYEERLKMRADEIWAKEDLEKAVNEFLALAPGRFVITREILRFKSEQLLPMLRQRDQDPRLEIYREMEKAWKAFIREQSVKWSSCYMISLEGRIMGDGTHREFNLFFSENGLLSVQTRKSEGIQMVSLPIVIFDHGHGDSREDTLEITIGRDNMWRFSVGQTQVQATPLFRTEVMNWLRSPGDPRKYPLAPQCGWLQEAKELADDRKTGKTPFLAEKDIYNLMEKLLDGYGKNAPYPRAVIMEQMLRKLLDCPTAKEALKNRVPFALGMQNVLDDIQALLNRYGDSQQWQLRHALGDDGTMAMAKDLIGLGRKMDGVGEQARRYYSSFDFPYMEAGVVFWSHAEKAYVVNLFQPERPLGPQQQSKFFYLDPQDRVMRPCMTQTEGEWSVGKDIDLNDFRYLILYYQK